MSKKNDSLSYGVNRCTLSGPKSKQYRIRQNARFFAKTLREAGLGAQKWTKITNKHFQRVADQLRTEGVADGRIAEVFSAARHVCRAYGNERISRSNGEFGVRRGAITNQASRAASPEKVQELLVAMRADEQYKHASRAAAQIELMYELGLRREEAAKVDLLNDWDRERHSFLVQHGTKGGRPRMLNNLSKEQESALERALPFVSPSNRNGITNLMPEGMGDRWLNKLDYAARKCRMTKRSLGFTMHGNRHERFRQIYKDNTGFEPPNRFSSLEAFVFAARRAAGEAWKDRDQEARDVIEVFAGHSAGRRDISDAYLGSSG